MHQWFETIASQWSIYQLLSLGFVPAVLVFFLMYFLLLRARSDRRLAEWRLHDQQEESERMYAELRELEAELKLL